MDVNRICLKCLKPSMEGGRCLSCGSPEVFPQEPPFALPVRTILHGRYMVGAVLGFGGYGITYGGIDLKEERGVAIKEFMPNGQAVRKPGTCQVLAAQDIQMHEYGVRRFMDEARTIYQYDGNPGIVKVYQLFTENNTAYYAMEFLDGRDLKHMVYDAGGRLEYYSLLTIAIPVMDALSQVHSRHIIHRDVSPDNIFITSEGEVKLIDFGAARTAYAGKSRSLSVILKKGFAPEEQYRSRGHQGPWTDVYALAGTMYYCLTGIMPPEAPDRLHKDTIAGFADFGVSIPEYADAAIMKALSVRAAGRFASVAGFKAALLGEEEREGRREMDGAGSGYNGDGYERNRETPGRAWTLQVRIYGLSGCYRGASFSLSGTVVFGRSAEHSHLVFPVDAGGVSSIHCQITVSGDMILLQDLGSTYGTWLNGRKLPYGGQALMGDGDRIAFGEDQVFEIVI